jgi:hypothetical protein
MPKISFLLVIVGSQLFFVFLLINKSSKFIKESYEKQKLELTKSELLHKKEVLTNQLYAHKNPTLIKKFAQEILKLQPIKINQIKKIPGPEDLIHYAQQPAASWAREFSAPIKKSLTKEGQSSGPDLSSAHRAAPDTIASLEEVSDINTPAQLDNSPEISIAQTQDTHHDPKALEPEPSPDCFQENISLAQEENKNVSTLANSQATPFATAQELS